LILDFPVNLSELAQSTALVEKTNSLMKAYRETAVRREIPYKATGLVEYDEFYPRKVKDEIDKVDIVLGPIVGLTDEQVDFVCNFDLKFRTLAEPVDK
jgi:hypothetical protein